MGSIALDSRRLSRATAAQSVAQQTSSPVDEAVSSIKDSLTTSSHPRRGDRFVSHQDVKNVANTFASLNASQTQEAFDQLEQSGHITILVEEMNAGGLSFSPNRGFSVDEKRDFFNDMAQKLDGESLAKLSDAFAATNNKNGAINEVEMLGEAVATHATTQTKLDYIETMAANTTDKPSYSENFLLGGSASYQGDAEALAIGHVIASIDNNPVAAELAFEHLSTEQLQAVMDASIGLTSHFSRGGVSASFDATLAGQILETASTINVDADLKAKIFDAGANTLKQINNDFGFPVAAIGKNDSANIVADGLSKIIDSDTTGVIGELANSQATFGGGALSTYAKHLLNTGQTDKLGEQMAKLQFGNGLNEDPVARFDEQSTAPGGQVTHENATTLGYFVGSVYKAAESISSDVKEQRELTTAVLKSTLSAIDKVKITAGISAGASIAKEWVKFAVSAAIEDPGTSAAQQLEIAATPFDPVTDRPAVGGAAYSEFLGKISQIQRLTDF